VVTIPNGWRLRVGSPVLAKPSRGPLHARR
jgi:hypothetical protein